MPSNGERQTKRIGKAPPPRSSRPTFELRVYRGSDHGDNGLGAETISRHPTVAHAEQARLREARRARRLDHEIAELDRIIVAVEAGGTVRALNDSERAEAVSAGGGGA